MPSSTATTKQKAYLRGRLQLLERGGYKFFSEGIVIFQVFFWRYRIEEVETALVTWMFFPIKNRVTRNLIPWRKNHLLFFYLVFEISSFTDPCVNTPFLSQEWKKQWMPSQLLLFIGCLTIRRALLGAVPYQKCRGYRILHNCNEPASSEPIDVRRHL